MAKLAIVFLRLNCTAFSGRALEICVVSLYSHAIRWSEYYIIWPQIWPQYLLLSHLSFFLEVHQCLELGKSLSASCRLVLCFFFFPFVFLHQKTFPVHQSCVLLAFPNWVLGMWNLGLPAPFFERPCIEAYPKHCSPHAPSFATCSGHWLYQPVR